MNIKSEQKNILFVDDEPTIVSSLKMVFRKDKKQFKIFTSTDQQEALKIIRENKIHVVVSDMRMPGMNGAELLSEVKRSSPNSMRMLLTGYSEMDNIIKSVNTGQVYRFLEKPWVNNDIKTKIKEAADISGQLWSTSPDIAVGGGTHSEPEKITTTGKAVLFIGSTDSRVFNILNAKTDYNIHQVTTIQQAIVTLTKHEEITVITVNTNKNYRDLVSLLKILKAEFPMLVSVVVTGDKDSRVAITLVNEAQVFRYISEPFNDNEICDGVENALQYASVLNSTPILINRHKVEKMSTIERESITKKIGDSLLGEISKRFARIFSFGRKSPDRA